MQFTILNVEKDSDLLSSLMLLIGIYKKEFTLAEDPSPYQNTAAAMVSELKVSEPHQTISRGNVWLQAYTSAMMAKHVDDFSSPEMKADYCLDAFDKRFNPFLVAGHNKATRRQQLIDVINKTVNQAQTLGAEEIADAILAAKI